MRLSRSAERLLDILCWYGKKFRRIYPSQAKLSSHLGVTIRQVQRLVRELRDAGFVIAKKAAPCGGKSTYFRSKTKIQQLFTTQNVGSKSVPSRIDVAPQWPRPYIWNRVLNRVRKACFPELRTKPPEQAPNHFREGITMDDVRREYRRIYGCELETA